MDDLYLQSPTLEYLVLRDGQSGMEGELPLLIWVESHRSCTLQCSTVDGTLTCNRVYYADPSERMKNMDKGKGISFKLVFLPGVRHQGGTAVQAPWLPAGASSDRNFFSGPSIKVLSSCCGG